MLSRVARFLWKAVKWTFLVAVTLFALAVLINWWDEPLSDDARALLETTPVEVPDNENIFVAMAGFNAPEGKDIFEAGRRHIEEIEKALEQDPMGLSLSFEHNKELWKREELRWQEATPPFDCRINEETDYWECIHSQKERLEKTLEANETLIQRYRLLQDLPHFVGSPHSSPYFLWHSQAEYTWRALVAQAILDIEAGNAEAGLTFFKKDMMLWRRSLEGSCYLVDTMIAVARMARNARGLSLLLSSPSTKLKGQEAEWRELLTPLSHEQYSLRSAIEQENRFVYRAFQGMKRWMPYREGAEPIKNYICQNTTSDTGFCYEWLWWWLEQNAKAFFHPPVATFNYSVPFYQAWLNLTDLSWKDYIEQRDQVLTPLAELTEPRIGWIYNPVGKAQTRLLLSLWNDYVGRLHDLDTYLRLVRLQLELRLAKMSSEDVPSFIEKLDEAYCAPCSDFSWDVKTRMLSFQPYVKKEKGGLTRFAPALVYVPEIRE
ncbi:MAG: hypothetical protein FWC38_09750 [Proteobacteria bacterium]|nr:hypothetical protein [Pseudomonadota bacterium]MCL2308481.1 hypothetical protein [Pseudomonadota bacterium]